VGNRTLLHNAAGRTTYTYDVGNQLETAVLGAARTTYTYDLNGNLEVENASGTLTTHTWNDENQLTQVAKTGMTTNQYTFNGDGQRVQIVDSQGTKKPIWDFQNILLETDGSNVTQVVYTLEPNVYGNLVSQRRSSTTSYYLFDALGSTRKLTDSASSITDSYDYRAYGETFASTVVTTNVFRWVGQVGYYFDIDRLAYYLRARSYNPAVARFLSRDPIGFDGSRWNVYEYASSRPSHRSDANGLTSLMPCPSKIVIPCSAKQRRPASVCCQLAQNQGLAGTAAGGVICCDGRKVPCVWLTGGVAGGGGTGNATADAIIDACILAHERDHFDDIPDCPRECLTLTRPPFRFWANPSKEECNAYRMELDCLSRANCGGDPACEAAVDNAISFVVTQITVFCKGVY
jgi:RHS repeat-associated protein